MPIEVIPLGLFEGELFTNVNAFLVFMTVLAAVLGFLSGYASIGAYGAFASFGYIAVETDLWIFNSLLYVVLAIVFVVMGIQVWGFVSGDGGEAV